MTEAEIVITKTTDRDGRVLTVRGWVSINTGDEYIPDYIRTRSGVSLSHGTHYVSAKWTQEGAGIAVVAERRAAGPGSEPAELVQAIEEALRQVRGYCHELSTTARHLTIIARHHANLAGPSEQLLARIDRIEADVLEAKSLAAASAQELTLRASDVEERQF